jgi:hypothetical protein
MTINTELREEHSLNERANCIADEQLFDLRLSLWQPCPVSSVKEFNNAAIVKLS